MYVNVCIYKNASKSTYTAKKFITGGSNSPLISDKKKIGAMSPCLLM
jgi:hypothetical protein